MDDYAEASDREIKGMLKYSPSDFSGLLRESVGAFFALREREIMAMQKSSSVSGDHYECGYRDMSQSA